MQRDAAEGLYAGHRASLAYAPALAATQGSIGDGGATLGRWSATGYDQHEGQACIDGGVLRALDVARQRSSREPGI